MQGEFRERLERLEMMCEQMMAAVKQAVELEASTIKQVSIVEDRAHALEDSGEYIFCSYLR